MFDVITCYEKVSAELVEKFSLFDESASLHECMGKRGSLGNGVRPIWPGTRLCGVALTVHLRPGDNLMLHKAIDMIQPGDVLVVSVDGCPDYGGMWGGLMTASAVSKKCAGLVTDGAVRDTMMIQKLGFPVFSSAINVNGTTKNLPGTINYPITIHNVTIHPGDLVFGDNDGVVVVPRDEAASVYEEAMRREEKEDILMKRIMQGEGTTFDLSGFNEKYYALGLTEEP